MSGVCNDCHNHPCVCGMGQAGSGLSEWVGQVEYEWTITDYLGLVLASGTAPTEGEANREMEHYAMQYSLDETIQVSLARLYTTRSEIKRYTVTA